MHVSSMAINRGFELEWLHELQWKMSNTVITNYTDLNGPSTKADSSVVVIVNKDGSLSVDQKLLGTLMGKHSISFYDS